MKKHIEKIKEFKKLAGQKCPDTYEVPSIEDRVLTIRLIIEEALEMASALGVRLECNNDDGNPKIIESSKDLEYFVCQEDINPVEVLDASCDLFWVSFGGPAALIGLSHKLEECLEEVTNSNMSKFIDGHKCPDSGKWIKGPSYSPANIEGILNSEI